LWALAHAKELPIPEILATAQSAGFDLTPLLPMLASA